ncbi:hypothetical protein FRC12_020359 [Ceratobasidium sp. 428]|nr:hypothetical protein FRC09_008210 [Ceratobasidium sp. 395]KAG8730286.1 hypothetical protein FRC12_020359 [Ceratobasidium sp. 428]
MDMDHEIALMYATTPFGMFQPRTVPYSPFRNIVLQVVPPRPTIEDLVFQILGGVNNSSEDYVAPDSRHQEAATTPADSTPEFDISERMAREMQEQEDREQELRDRRAALSHQMGEFMSSMFGGLIGQGEHPAPILHQRNVNAEAGSSTIKPQFSFPSTRWPAGSNSVSISAGDDQVAPDDSNRSAGKQRARESQVHNLALSSNPMGFLDNAEAALKHEINKFDFPERLEFLDSIGASGDLLPSTAPPVPVLAHTANNAPVHAHEQALLGLLTNLDAVANDEEEGVRTRQLLLVERIKREMEELDKKILELWAAGRKYTSSRMETDV